MPLDQDAERTAQYIEEFGDENWNLLSEESKKVLLQTESRKPFNRDYVNLNTGEKVG